jgi:hypothetical protein
MRLLDEDAVSHRYQPIGGRRHTFVMRDNHERLPAGTQLLEQPQHLQGGSAIEIASWLVGEHDPGFVAKRPGDRDALPLTAGQRRWEMPRTIVKADLLEQLLRPGSCSSRRSACQQRRQLDVLGCGQLFDKMKGLEDETD